MMAMTNSAERSTSSITRELAVTPSADEAL